MVSIKKFNNTKLANDEQKEMLLYTVSYWQAERNFIIRSKLLASRKKCNCTQ